MLSKVLFINIYKSLLSEQKVSKRQHPGRAGAYRGQVVGV